jgi:uncharacterized membrane protein YfcA
VTFPALLFAGISPVTANATSTIALWPGTVASAFAYRRELHDVRRELLPMGFASLVGGLAGSLVLLRTSDSTFILLIPWLLLFATVLFSFGGWMATRLLRGARAPLALATVAQVFVAIYGGYFGGGIGIMMLAILSVLGMANIHRMNALKTVLGALINGVAVIAFILAGAVAWAPGVAMIAGGVTGGYAGAAVARRVDPKHVRWLVLGVAWTMTAYFFVRTYR